MDGWHGPHVDETCMVQGGWQLATTVLVSTVCSSIVLRELHKKSRWHQANNPKGRCSHLVKAHE